MRRRIALWAVVLSLLMCTACQPSQSIIGKPTEQTKTMPECDKKLTISANIQDAEAMPGTALWDDFQKLFNVEIDLWPLTFNNRHEQTRQWIASGNMPDLMWMDLDETMFAEYANWSLQDMFEAYPTMEELEEKWPNIAEIYNRSENVGDELMTVSGKRYAHPVLRENPEYNFMSAMGWIYRRDWAKQLGLYQEDDIYTWNEWVELNRAFVEQDPGENGAGRTIGMDTELFYFPNAMGVYQTSAEYGYGAFSPKDGEYVWTAARPETLEGLKIAKELYDDGIIWSDNQLGQLPDDMFKAGLMGSDFNNFTIARLYNVRRGLKENFPDIDENEAAALAKVIGPDDTIWCKQSQCYYGAVLMRNGIGEEKMTRWLDMLNWMLSDEGIYFRAYGIEGKDWKYNDDGSVECLWPDSTVIEGSKVDPYPDWSRIFFQRYADAFTLEQVPNPAYPQQYLDDLNDIYNFRRDHGFMRRFDYESSYLSAPNKNRSGNFSTETSDMMIELITTASAEELPELWNNWLIKMRPKVQPVLNELNTMISNVPEEAEPKLYAKK